MKPLIWLIVALIVFVVAILAIIVVFWAARNLT